MLPYNENIVNNSATYRTVSVGDREDDRVGVSAPMRVLLNHIYEYQKGMRRMVLYTFHKRYMRYAIERLQRQGIDYVISPLQGDNVNLFFGRRECLDAIRLMVPVR